ncbi:MAG: hypothetical protein ABI765_00295 [Gemmatimonadota bacterium]
MRRLSAALLLILLARPALAQQTGDQPKITLGITGGLVTGSSLWSVDGQPYTPSGAFSADTLSLSRNLSTGFTFGLTTSYFPGSHLGLTGEIALLGLGSKTTCTITATHGSSETSDLCHSLGLSNTAGTSVGISLGGVYRIASRQDVSPFFSVRIGALISEESTVDLRGYYFSDTLIASQQVTVPVFNDPNKNRIDIYGQLAAGFAIAAGHGYQIRLEARDNYVRLPVPLGPSAEGSGIFPRGRVSKHLFSVVLGFDIILEKKRGRRY